MADIGKPAPGAAPQADTHQCDLVMQGGITSGVVYPRLIAELAGKYPTASRATNYAPDDVKLAKACLERVIELGALLNDASASLEEKAPSPRAAMRIAPRI